MQLRAAEDVVWCPGEGELIVFSANDGGYYGLDEVAARIWTRFNAGAGPDEVVETLLAEFDVDRRTAGSEVERMLVELIRLRLLVDD